MRTQEMWRPEAENQTRGNFFCSSLESISSVFTTKYNLSVGKMRKGKERVGKFTAKPRRQTNYKSSFVSVSGFVN